jgi:AraC-like DNA-binding protein
MAGTPAPGAAVQIECCDAGAAVQLLAEVFDQCLFKPLPDNGTQFRMVVTRLGYEVASFVHWQFETSGELTLFLDRHLVLTALRGTIIVRRNGTEITIDRTSALILPPGLSMTVIWSDGVVFTGILIRDAEFQRGARAILPSATKMSLDGERQFDLSTYPGTVFAELMEFLETDRKNGRASQHSKSVRQLFDRLTIYTLLRVVEGQTRSDGGVTSIVPRHVKQSEEYVKSHLNEILDTGVLAALVDVSPRSLYRAFINFRGISPARYIQDVRLDAAHRLITGGEKRDLYSIAESTGFKSYAAFWRSYVRKYGIAPSKARRETE